MGPRVAIVTTLRGTGAVVLDSFIRYHVGLGFARLYLFFDDPDDDALGCAEGRPAVTVTRSDAGLAARWRATRCFARRGHELAGAGAIAGDHVMLRQQLNVEVAAGLALADGMEWLLHIDADELFHSAARSVAEHFQELTDRGVSCVTYANHEGVPERVDIDDYFREVTLFKRNRAALAPTSLAAEKRALLRAAPQLPDRFFHFYTNGKSAARLSTDLWANGVHDFYVPAASQRATTSADPAILHYACCGFDHFWTKYRTLGRFADRWGDRDIRDAIGDTHLDARDVVTRGDREAARAFYERRIVLQDPDVIAALIEGGLAVRIDGPARLVAGYAVTST